jgi:hypothetical protein
MRVEVFLLKGLLLRFLSVLLSGVKKGDKIRSFKCLLAPKEL